MSSIPSPLPLEDSWTDVLNKAIRGSGVEEKNLSASANITPSQLKSILKGDQPSEDTLRRLAIAVGLRPTPFLNLAFNRYKPKPFVNSQWPGVLQISTQYMDMIVNAYLVWDTKTLEAVLFDTGTNLPSIKNALETYKLKLTTICITHTHGDHIAVLNDLISTYQPKVYSPKTEPVEKTQLLEDNTTLSVGNLKIQSILTDGHSVGHFSYLVTGNPGWSAPVAIVGDSLFAGSMGGGAISYQRLRTNVQTKILILPEQTLLCPGHGPITTVAEENSNNPFG